MLATSFGYLIGSAKVLNVQTSNYFTHASLVASSLPYVQIDCLSVAHMTRMFLYSTSSLLLNYSLFSRDLSYNPGLTGPLPRGIGELKKLTSL